MPCLHALKNCVLLQIHCFTKPPPNTNTNTEDKSFTARDVCIDWAMTLREAHACCALRPGVLEKKLSRCISLERLV